MDSTVTTPTRVRTPMNDLARRGVTVLVVAVVAVAIAVSLVRERPVA